MIEAVMRVRPASPVSNGLPFVPPTSCGLPSVPPASSRHLTLSPSTSSLETASLRQLGPPASSRHLPISLSSNLSKVEAVRRLPFVAPTSSSACSFVPPASSRHLSDRQTKSVFSILFALILSIITNTTCATIAWADNTKPSEKLMSLSEARQYMLKLINHDRAINGVGPVRMNSIAQVAAQKHAEECSEHMYLAHWDLLVRKPWERYTEVGGKDNNAENVAFTGLYMEGVQAPDLLPLPENQLFAKKPLEEMESAMINEKAPHDGHRVNIIDPHHTSVGIGVAIATDGNYTRVTLDQEFLNEYGTYDPLPAKLNPTQPLFVSGTLKPGYQLSNILLEWEPTPQAMTPSQLNSTSSYGWPEKTVVTCAPRQFLSDAPVDITPRGNSESFMTQIPPLSRASNGIYYVVIWAKNKNKPEDQFVASVRTLSLGPRATLLAMAHPKSKAPIKGTTTGAATTTSTSTTTPSKPSGPPDLSQLYFHPELGGAKVIPATAGRGGLRPDMSRFFFKPAPPPDTDSDTKPTKPGSPPDRSGLLPTTTT